MHEADQSVSGEKTLLRTRAPDLFLFFFKNSDHQLTDRRRRFRSRIRTLLTELLLHRRMEHTEGRADSRRTSMWLRKHRPAGGTRPISKQDGLGLTGRGPAHLRALTQVKRREERRVKERVCDVTQTHVTPCLGQQAGVRTPEAAPAHGVQEPPLGAPLWRRAERASTADRQTGNRNLPAQRSLPVFPFIFLQSCFDSPIPHITVGAVGAVGASPDQPLVCSDKTMRIRSFTFMSCSEKSIFNPHI